MKNILLSIVFLFGLASCSSTQERMEIDFKEKDVIDVVTDYETALKTYDSYQTVKYLHPECIANQYGTVENYHKIMEKAFFAIKRDGGIRTLAKGDVSFKGNVAYVESVIKTEKHEQRGIVELKQLNGQWLISKLP